MDISLLKKRIHKYQIRNLKVCVVSVVTVGLWEQNIALLGEENFSKVFMFNTSVEFDYVLEATRI